MVRNCRDVGYTDHRQCDSTKTGISPEKESRLQYTYQTATPAKSGPSRGQTNICQVSHSLARVHDIDSRFALPFLNAIWRKYSIRRISVRSLHGLTWLG